MNLFKRQALSTLPQLPLFSQLSDEMNRFFDRDLHSLENRFDVMGTQWQPAIDIEQKDKEYVIRADVPGVEPKDIKVFLDNGLLTIEGKRDTKAEVNKEDYRCIERSYGSFYRCVRLPEAVEAENIKAHNHNGVLEVTIPRAMSSNQKAIPVLSD